MSIFLSYSSKDVELVTSIAKELKGAGLSVFFDKYNLEGGCIWTKEIQKGILNSTTALIFIGESGVGHWQNKEILKILNDKEEQEGYRVIPVILPSNSGLSQQNLPWYLADHQWIMMSGFQDEFNRKKILEMFDKADTSSSPKEKPKNPYKGLASYNVEDAPFFFGRDYDVNVVFYEVLKLHYGIPGNNFLAVVSESGTGKSSFVKAGILAALKNGRFEGSESWQQIILRPGKRPLQMLSEQLVVNNVIGNSREFEKNCNVNDDKDNNGTLARVLREKRIDGEKKTWVLYIDQFEEIVSQTEISEEERTSFLANLARAVEEKNVIVICSLRTDYYDKFTTYKQFNYLLKKHNYTLPKIEVAANFERADDNHVKFRGLSSEEYYKLKDIIQKPAQLCGIKVSNELVNSIIEDLKSINGPLPIIQLCMSKLYQTETGDIIDNEDYARESGGKDIKGIVEKHADEVFNRITNYEKDTAKVNCFKNIFIPHLVVVNSVGEDVRRVASFHEINPRNDSSISLMLDELVGEKSRLLIRSNVGNETVLEVVHEVLIREWSILKDWIHQQKDAIRFKTRLDEILESDHPIIDSQTELRKAVKWKKNHPNLNTDTTNRLIEDSKSKNRTRLVKTGLLIAVLLILLISPFIVNIMETNRKNNKELYEIGEKLKINNPNQGYLKIATEDYSEFKKYIKRRKLPKRIVHLEIADNCSKQNIEITKNLNSVKHLSVYTGGDINIKSKASTFRKVVLNARNVILPSKMHHVEVLNIEASNDTLDLSLDMPVLKELSISQEKNTHTAFPEDMQFLNKLSISHDGNSGSVDWPKDLSNLKALALDLNNKVEWPNNLTSLESLTINADDKQIIPDNLSSLKTLNIVSHDEISPWQLPKGLTSLESLIIDATEGFITIPDGLSNLKTLNVMGEYGSKIDPLPEDLDSLESLKITMKNYVWDTIILPDNLSTLKLLDIDFYFDHGKRLIKQPSNLVSLESLKVRNSISQIEWLKDLTLLESLEMSLKLSDGDTIILPNNLSNLKVLNLDLDGFNGSIKWPNSLTSLDSLKILFESSLINTNILPNDLSNLKALELDFEYGVDTLKLPDNLESLESLKLSGHYGRELVLPNNLLNLRSLEFQCYQELINWPNNLESLRIGECQGDGSIDLPNDLSNLKTLDIYQYGVIKWPTSLASLNSLTITANSNDSIVLPENLSNLKSLNVTCGKGSIQWPENLSSLESLSISSKSTIAWPQSLKQLQNFQIGDTSSSLTKAEINLLNDNKFRNIVIDTFQVVNNDDKHSYNYYMKYPETWKHLKVKKSSGLDSLALKELNPHMTISYFD